MSRIALLLPTSSYRATDFIAAAKALDVDVVVACDRRQALSRVMGDRALTLPLSRPEQAASALVAHAQRLRLDAIVAVDDQGVEVAALAATRLGLPHNPPQVAALTRDKAALRRALVGRVPQPDFLVVGPDDDVAAAAAEVGPPVVMKPVSLSASRGVIRADDPEQAVGAAARIRHILACANTDPRAPLLVERYVAGAEVAVEGLLRGGRLEVLAVFDKPDPLEGPYFEETLYVTPSRLPSHVVEQ
ncbi:MAG: ATP-grasp domain-containing protein, partial [Actinomycetota bacterium]|nr:ATP-grasp domain-containing protein [Actinomycetota bacterium]